MIATAESPDVLRSKIKHSLDIMDTDELKRLYQFVSGIVAEKVTKFADMDWVEKGLSRDLIKEEVDNYRKSKNR